MQPWGLEEGVCLAIAAMMQQLRADGTEERAMTTATAVFFFRLST